MSEPKWKRVVSRERMRQLHRNAEGLCSVSRCKGRVFKGGKCKADYAKDLERLRKSYAAKKGGK